jgi:hypothetical protein
MEGSILQGHDMELVGRKFHSWVGILSSTEWNSDNSLGIRVIRVYQKAVLQLQKAQCPTSRSSTVTCPQISTEF